MVQNMSRTGSRILDTVLLINLKGVEPLLQYESRSAGFGAKVAPSLNGVDLSFMSSVSGSY
jgi:hypothetical protein